MFWKRGKRVNCHIVCPDCGNQLLSCDTGRYVCSRCDWSWTPPVGKTVLEDYFDRTLTSPFMRRAMMDGLR